MRWWMVLLGLTISVVVPLLLGTQYNAEGDACNDPTALILLSPGYTDGDAGGYPDDPTSCARAARRQGAAIAVLALAGGTATVVAFRRGQSRRRAV